MAAGREQEPGGLAGRLPHADLRDAKGVQIGSGVNVQFNDFRSGPAGDSTEIRADLTIRHVLPGMLQPTARSAYLEQVRRIAPPDPPGLMDREAEMAEMARFCLAPDGPSYAWWRAGPWAGKSALLSTFVLRPPDEVAGRVRFVSFFITARLAAQDTREEFTEVLLEQLAALLGQSLPAVLPAAIREAYLLSLMSQAARACAEEGGRLVLVVDGLDEDRGVTTGPDVHSIAGLLPVDPRAGMRVIVAGRPNPPVPDDVPDWHPLRDTGIIRPLAASPHARDVKRLGRQELQRLLRGSTAEQDVLGLLTAARGGLTARDLTELIGVPLWQVEEIVHTVAGRTLECRPSLLDSAVRPEVYLLGHEELQAAATDYLGDRHSGYREQLHAWAAGWRARGWPPETPEYLLAGYFRLLEDLGDLPRMTELAGDMARHDRMLDLTGGDAVALAEARATLDRIASDDTPDLADALALACHRDYLADRNAHIPAALPAVWAAIGQLPRAEALARSITDPDSQASALAQVAETLAQAGRYRQAGAIAVQAQAIARSSADSDWQVRVQARVAGVLARAGQDQQAETIARSIKDPEWQAIALAEVAGMLARAGQYQQAETIARSIEDPGSRVHALAEAARALARAGNDQQAEAIALQAEAAARSVKDPGSRVRALAEAARALARAGNDQQAEAIALQAEAAARSVKDPGSRVRALAEAARALARAGNDQQAEAIALQAEAAARSVKDPGSRVRALAEAVQVLARAGQDQQAEVIARQAEGVARTIEKPEWRASDLVEAVGALARAGQHLQAEAIALQAEAAARAFESPGWRVDDLVEAVGALAQAGQHQQAGGIAGAISDPESRARALAEVAGALARAGQHLQAEAVALQAEAAARSINSPGWRSVNLVEAVGALAQAGQHRQAENAARFIKDPESLVSALAAVAGALTRDEQQEQARAIALQAEAAARAITPRTEQLARALVTVAGALAQAGRQEQARAVALVAEGAAYSVIFDLGDGQGRAIFLEEIGEALARAGQYQQAEVMARSISELSGPSPSVLAEVAVAMAQAGQYQQAEAIAQSIDIPGLSASALAEVAVALAQAGQYQQAEAIALQAGATARSISGPEPRVQALAKAARALAWAGQHQQAEAIAHSITDVKVQACALAEAAGALAQAGQHEHAEVIALQAEAAARSITDSKVQVRILAQVAGILARAGESRSASRMAALTCAVGQWTAAVVPVLLLMPSAYTTLARVLEEGH